MKKLMMSVLTLAFLASAGFAQAEDKPKKGERGPAAKKGERPDRAERMKKILAEFDKNKDGKLDETEKKAAREAMAKRRGQGGPGRGISPEKRAELMKKYDTNGDGKLDEKERAELRKELQKNRGQGGPGKGKPGPGKKPESKE